MKANESEILLVEDNPSDAKLTLIAMKESGIKNTIVYVKNGEEALEYIFSKGIYSGRKTAKTPGLILLDLKMPKINGMEVLIKLKRDERTQFIPIVIFTSSQENDDIKACYNLGANSYVVKPVEPEKFSKAVADTGLYWLLINQLPE